MTNLAIILCTYNGEEFLKDQLQSFNKQSRTNWHLFVYDDGSTDNTKNLVHGNIIPSKVTFATNSTNLGFAKNFLNALHNTPSSFDFYALSDQDDIWLEHKLERAVSYLKTVDSTIPAVYCSRTTLIDSSGNIIGQSKWFKKKPSFSNSLVQSIAGGNTMVLNQAAHNLIKKTDRNLDTVSHDWFIYQLISGAGGVLHYDPHSDILYRQHNYNIIGSNNTILGRLFRLKMLLNNSFKNWIDINIKSIHDNANLLTEENRRILNLFEKSRKSSLLPRLIGFWQCRIYRQTLIGNLGLFVGAVLNKI